jgi:transforming growth factor-beta-induced protein
MIRPTFPNVAAAAALVLIQACASPQTGSQETGSPETVAEQTAPAGTIAEIAAESGNFTTLVAALDAAGLVETLNGPGPFTVFAPTDSAFAQLPAGTVEALLADTAQLASVLTYHVVPGKVMASDIVGANGARPATVNGQTVDVVVRDGMVYVNGARVVTADIVASNGVIHVVDAVLLPQAVSTQ